MSKEVKKETPKTTVAASKTSSQPPIIEESSEYETETDEEGNIELPLRCVFGHISRGEAE